MKDFEKDIKKHFHQREIQPSADAWERMEMLLDKKQPKKRKSYGYLWSAAASVILMIGLWSILKEPEEDLRRAVEQPVIVEDAPTQKTTSKTEKQKVVSNQSTVQKPVKSAKQKAQPQSTSTEEYVVAEEENPKKKPEELSTDFSIVYPSEDNKEEKLFTERKPVEIYVNPEKLLHNAEIERQMENIYTDGQNLWRKIKEINASVEHNKMTENEENNF